MVVMRDMTQKIERPLACCLLGQLHRPAHTIAKAGGLCKLNIYATPSPSARIRAIKSSAMRWLSSEVDFFPAKVG